MLSYKKLISKLTLWPTTISSAIKSRNVLSAISVGTPSDSIFSLVIPVSWVINSGNSVNPSYLIRQLKCSTIILLRTLKAAISIMLI